MQSPEKQTLLTVSYLRAIGWASYLRLGSVFMEEQRIEPTPFNQRSLCLLKAIIVRFWNIDAGMFLVIL